MRRRHVASWHQHLELRRLTQHLPSRSVVLSLKPEQQQQFKKKGVMSPSFYKFVLKKTCSLLLLVIHAVMLFINTIVNVHALMIIINKNE